MAATICSEECIDEVMKMDVARGHTFPSACQSALSRLTREVP